MAKAKTQKKPAQEEPKTKSPAKKKKTTRAKSGDRHWLTAPALKRIIAARVGATSTKTSGETGMEEAANPRLSKDAIPMLQKVGDKALKKLISTAIKMLGTKAKTVTEEALEMAAHELGMPSMNVQDKPVVAKSLSKVKNVGPERQTCLASASVTKSLKVALTKDHPISSKGKVCAQAYVEEAIGNLLQHADRFRHAGQKSTIRTTELDYALEVVCHKLF